MNDASEMVKEKQNKMQKIEQRINKEIKMLSKTACTYLDIKNL